MGMDWEGGGGTDEVEQRQQAEERRARGLVQRGRDHTGQRAGGRRCGRHQTYVYCRSMHMGQRRRRLRMRIPAIPHENA
jgi:hypothetical protein